MIKKIIFVVSSVPAWAIFAAITLRFNCNGEIRSLWTGNWGLGKYEYLQCQNIFNWPAAVFGIVVLGIDFYYGWQILKWLIAKFKKGAK